MCVSERWRLPVFGRSQSLPKLLPEFREAVVAVLRQIGVQEAAIRAEKLHMEDVEIGSTSSRSVLGSMNDFKILGRSSSGTAALTWWHWRSIWRRRPAGPSVTATRRRPRVRCSHEASKQKFQPVSNFTQVASRRRKMVRL